MRAAYMLVITCILLTGCIRSHKVLQAPTAKASPEELGGPIPAETIKEARENFRNYMVAYLEQASARTRAYQWGSDVAAFGGVVGAAGGLTKSPETSILGLLLGTGGGYGEQRYHMRVQATNFTKAAASMRCLGNTLTPDPRPEILAGDPQTEFEIVNLANKHSDIVFFRLLDAQRAIEPTAVNTDAVREAIKSEMEGMQAKNTFLESRTDKNGFVESLSLADQATLREEVIKELDGKMGQCSNA